MEFTFEELSIAQQIVNAESCEDIDCETCPLYAGKFDCNTGETYSAQAKAWLDEATKTIQGKSNEQDETQIQMAQRYIINKRCEYSPTSKEHVACHKCPLYEGEFNCGHGEPKEVVKQAKIFLTYTENNYSTPVQEFKCVPQAFPVTILTRSIEGIDCGMYEAQAFARFHRAERNKLYDEHIKQLPKDKSSTFISTKRLIARERLVMKITRELP